MFTVKGPNLGIFEKVDEQILWEITFKSFLMKSLCETSISVSDTISPESIEMNGLVIGIYTINNF